jgi:hypothetical protein
VASAVLAHEPVGGDVLVVHGERLALEECAHGVDRPVLVPCEDAPHPVDGPEEVHRGGTGRGEAATEPVEIAREIARAQRAGAERDAHAGRHTDRRRAPDDHVLDRARDLAMVAVDPIDLSRRQQALVDHDHAAVPPFDRAHRHEFSGRGA